MKVTVIGAGSWGSAIANVVSHNVSELLLCSRNESSVKEINEHHTNKKHVPGIVFPDNVSATCDLIEAAKFSDLIFIVIPTSGIADLIEQIKPHLKDNTRLVICTKGLIFEQEKDRVITISSYIKNLCPNVKIGLLYGPNFADEVACGSLGVTNIAYLQSDVEYFKDLAPIFKYKNFAAIPLEIEKLECFNNLEIISAVKNVYAIAMGTFFGFEHKSKQNFYNGIAALFYSISKEILYKFGHHLFAIPAGIGDMALTCYSKKSRNFTYGYKLATGQDTSHIGTVEGVATSKFIHSLFGDELPICKEVYSLVFEHKNISVFMERVEKVIVS